MFWNNAILFLNQVKFIEINCMDYIFSHLLITEDADHWKLMNYEKIKHERAPLKNIQRRIKLKLKFINNLLSRKNIYHFCNNLYIPEMTIIKYLIFYMLPK